jgi:hypothetical protein
MSSIADLLNRLRYFIRAEAETQFASLDCIFQHKAASDSEPCRPPNPKHVGHRFLSMVATFEV